VEIAMLPIALFVSNSAPDVEISRNYRVIVRNLSRHMGLASSAIPIDLPGRSSASAPDVVAEEPPDDGVAGMHWEQKVEYAALSDIGFRRRNNQDSYSVQISGDREQWNERGHLFLVADGMGGHAVGELASKIAADIIPHTFHKLKDLPADQALKAAVLAGNATINARGEMNRDFTRMGTTCTTLVLDAEGALIAHVGDSRAYLIRDGEIRQLTRDHSLVAQLVRDGQLTPAQAKVDPRRNVVTRSVGVGAHVEIDADSVPGILRPGDTVMVCSDGLHGVVADEELKAAASRPDLGEGCREAIQLANDRGGPDNITVVLARVRA
jgi:protein phosphatase